MSAVVEVFIDPEGNATIKVSGVSGPLCKKITEKLEKKLGLVTKTTPTKEMNQHSTTSASARNQSRL